jgi:hypothetical protein
MTCVVLTDWALEILHQFCEGERKMARKEVTLAEDSAADPQIVKYCHLT